MFLRLAAFASPAFEHRMVRIKHTAHPRVLPGPEIVASDDVSKVCLQPREGSVEAASSQSHDDTLIKPGDSGSESRSGDSGDTASDSRMKVAVAAAAARITPSTLAFLMWGGRMLLR
jgi:hypothetical protein